MYMIVGASGFLGAYLIDELLEITDEEIIAVYHNRKGIQRDDRIKWIPCDISNLRSVERLNAEFKHERKRIVFLTAYHNPDMVFENPSFAWNINIVALSNFINVLNNVEGFIYSSTDSVYGNSINGQKYLESSELNPVNIYGKHKVLAEQIVVCYGYNVVRLPFMIGHSMAVGKKHFYDKIIETLKSGNEMEMFVDSYRSTISFRQAAQYILTAFEFINKHDFPQVINLCADEGISKFEMGQMVAKTLGLRETLIKPIYLKDNRTIFKTLRADSTIMDNTLMKMWYGVKDVKFDVKSC